VGKGIENAGRLWHIESWNCLGRGLVPIECSEDYISGRLSPLISFETICNSTVFTKRHVRASLLCDLTEFHLAISALRGYQLP